ncbi:GerAB/ArcD/ProY family transporter [Sporosarcina sp. P1]|uniref:GerAB/ArcD/ProY family transporter n=1 Tax=Sporosarcina sp. P1 TaxID=2048257 RepID=UPI000C16BD39|nr:GerAB/ArcD/ProY family transporter [Sporosarcina sp. P1]PIC83200.1 MFS transporter permease [Sporosarcina sp. P1]
MSRFVYLLLISNMIANLIASSPRILFAKSEHGAIVTMIIALFFGVFMNWALITSFKAFPGKSLPQILTLYLSKWIAIPALFIFGVIWYVSGLQTLITYIDILLRFITPEMSIYLVIAMFIPVITFGIIMQSRNILFTIELVFILALPVAAYYVIKLYFTEQVSWDQVAIAMTFIDNPPDYTVFSATTYLFVGAFDIIIFNSLLKKKMTFGIKQALIVFSLGVFMIFTTYFIPIGVLGFDQVENILYPWILTSDSIRMKFGVIERVIFIFLLLFLAIAFLNITIHWHVACKLFQSVFDIEKMKIKSREKISFMIVIVIFWLIAIYTTLKVTEYDLFLYSKYFFNSIPIVFIGLMIIMLVVNRRVKS